MVIHLDLVPFNDSAVLLNVCLLWFEGFKPQNRGQTGSRYVYLYMNMYIYIYNANIDTDSGYLK